MTGKDHEIFRSIRKTAVFVNMVERIRDDGLTEFSGGCLPL
jgi:hypothetical protein